MEPEKIFVCTTHAVIKRQTLNFEFITIIMLRPIRRTISTDFKFTCKFFRI